MVSVALATYNSKKYIIEQLTSIVRQKVSVDEVIIQDDCSKDDTIEVITKYIHDNNLKNWKIEKNEKNLGYILTFKKAIQRCNGDIIILCDHDDIWFENKSEIIKKIFNDKEKVLALATSFVEIDENGKKRNTKIKKGHANNNLIRHSIKKEKLNKMNFEDVAIYNISPGCTCAFSSKIKNDLLKKDYLMPHDLQIMNIAALKDGLFYYDIITTKYRIYSNNTIGLGHQTDYEKRLKLVQNGLKEKEEIKRLIGNIDNSKKQEIRTINKIIHAFELRKKMMETQNILKYGFITLINSLGLNKLYESVIMDIITIVKKQIRVKGISYGRK